MRRSRTRRYAGLCAYSGLGHLLKVQREAGDEKDESGQ